MIAVILAAGTSTRLRPLTNETPKTLLDVGGRTLIDRTLAALGQVGVTRAVIVSGYFSEKLRAHVDTLSLPFPVSHILNRRYAETANNYSLWLAAPEVAGHAMLLLDSDLLFAPKALSLVHDSVHENVLLMRTTGSLGAEEIKVQVDAQNRVTAIGKELDPANAAGESVGIERFSAPAAAALFSILDRRKDTNEFYEASFQELIDRGTPLHAVVSDGIPAMEIDTHEDLAIAKKLARSLT